MNLAKQRALALKQSLAKYLSSTFDPDDNYCEPYLSVHKFADAVALDYFHETKGQLTLCFMDVPEYEVYWNLGDWSGCLHSPSEAWLLVNSYYFN